MSLVGQVSMGRTRNDAWNDWAGNAGKIHLRRLRDSGIAVLIISWVSKFIENSCGSTFFKLVNGGGTLSLTQSALDSS